MSRFHIDIDRLLASRKETLKEMVQSRAEAHEAAFCEQHGIDRATLLRDYDRTLTQATPDGLSALLIRYVLTITPKKKETTGE